ncbi:MAG: hypothetical protein ACXABD_00355 [Candidatus Thorarchaeota archaeon]
MRVFLQDVPSVTVRIDETNPDVITSVRNITEIYTLDGIYECENEKVRKVDVRDKSIERHIFQGKPLVIDRSEIRYSNTVNNIDANHFAVSLERCELTLRRNAKISLIVEKMNSKIKQIYFDTNEDIKNYAIAEDFTTLLSLVS